MAASSDNGQEGVSKDLLEKHLVNSKSAQLEPRVKAVKMHLSSAQLELQPAILAGAIRLSSR